MKKSERVASELRKKIAHGDLSDGDELGSEAELIEMFQVSRPSLREAVRILESESLLKVTRGARGAKVQRPTLELPAKHMALLLIGDGVTIADLYGARIMIEPAAVRVIARDSWHKAPEMLREIIAKERECINDQAEFGRQSVNFHEALTSLAGNKTMRLMVGLLRLLYTRHAEKFTARLDAPRSFREQGLKAHERLVELIEACKPQEAEDFWRMHLEHVERILIQSDGFQELLELVD